MRMDLSGKGGYFRFDNATWREVLTLAYDHGWEPAGTEIPEYIVCNQDGTVQLGWTRAYREIAKDWDGTYFGNEGQLVTEEDAANIADALERALEAEPRDEEFGSGFTNYLREFIMFCRAGTFHIC